jgi:hypothetical protein
MLKFHMHARCGDLITRDEDVYIRSNLEFMRAEAFHSARELMAQGIRRGEAPELMNSFDITDESDHFLMNVCFGATLDRSMPKLEARSNFGG